MKDSFSRPKSKAKDKTKSSIKHACTVTKMQTPSPFKTEADLPKDSSSSGESDKSFGAKRRKNVHDKVN